MTALDKIVDPAYRADRVRQVEMLMGDAYRQFGIRALESPRRVAAIHEAGHAVVFEATADDVRWWRAYRLRIWPERVPGLVFWAGATDVSPKAPPEHVDCRTDPHGATVFALRALAGWAAEILFCPSEFRAASSLDELLVVGSCARDLATQTSRAAEAVFADLLSVTTGMLTANAQIVMNVARALEQSRKLDSADLRRLLRGVMESRS